MKKIIYTFLILVTVFVILTIYFLFTPIPKYLQSFVKNSVNEQLAKLSDYQMDSLSVETSLWGILQLKPYVLNVKLSDVKNNNNWVIIDGLLDTKMSGSIIQIKIKLNK